MASPRIVVLGSTGHVGQATLQSLSSKYGEEVEIVAGVRDPTKEGAKKLEELKGVSLVAVDMSDKDKVQEVTKGAHSVFVISPGAFEREKITKAAIDGALAGGAGSVVVVSVATTDEQDHLFAKQFLPVEEHLKAATDKYTILRLPIFIDNNWYVNLPVHA